MDAKYCKKAMKYQIIRSKVKKNNLFLRENVCSEAPPIIYLFLWLVVQIWGIMRLFEQKKNLCIGA